jgi:hypothetical protein
MTDPQNSFVAEVTAMHGVGLDMKRARERIHKSLHAILSEPAFFKKNEDQ